MKKMSEKNFDEKEIPQHVSHTLHQRRLEKPYPPGNQKIKPKINEQESGPRRERGKKQRRQFKLAPNRG
jgi:hypothetical protein